MTKIKIKKSVNRYFSNFINFLFHTISKNIKQNKF